MRQELQNCVAENGLGGSVIFAGSRRDVPDMLNLLDIFALTSLSEGTSISLLEAMASGVVPVVTDVGGNPAVVDNGRNGLTVTPRDVPGIADSIYELLADDSRRQAMSKAAICKVQEKYSIDTMVENYTALYLRLLENKKGFEDLPARRSPAKAGCAGDRSIIS
jgi:glycosyltransferase involved in cell wall biosynthesis